MRKSITLQRTLGIALLLALMVSFLYAAEEPKPTRQDNQRGQDRGQRGQDRGQRDRRGRGGFDRGQMQERMVEMLKERMGATDKEWTVIKPRLEKVMELSQNGRSNGMRSLFGRGRRGGREEATTPTEPVQIASDNLQKTLDKEAPSTAEIKAKLAALRGAREKNKQQLVITQQKLKEVLTVKQEALLVMTGMLE
ncbi:MAG: hypothetical protein KAJ07_05105 [Planctomycetes bacterium]|nr:hypothetical protein [Planctomycetota bacterium]